MEERESGRIFSRAAALALRLRGGAEKGKNAATALAERAGTAAGEAVEPFFSPPDGRESYFALGRRLLSKRFALAAVLALTAAAVLFATLVYPRLEGWLWPARLTLGEERLAAFTGEARLSTVAGAKIYEGGLADGAPSGRGEQYAVDGQLVYSGELAAGAYQGEGRYYEEGILRYAGGFQENLYAGDGEAYDAQGRLTYRGQFAQGQPSGTGVEYAPDTGRRRYAGGFSGGLREGRGTEYAADGAAVVYQGEFSGGVYAGTGRLYENGALRYAGAFEAGVYSGAGRLWDPETGLALYDGAFSNGLFEGEGRQYDGTGALAYAGSFAAGVRSGAGTAYDGLGRVLFTGNFRDGMPDLMAYLDVPADQLLADFGREETRKTVGGTTLLCYPAKGLTAVCQPDGEGGLFCRGFVTALTSSGPGGIARGDGREAVGRALGAADTVLTRTPDAWFFTACAALNAGLGESGAVLAEKYLRDGYFIRIYYHEGGAAAAMELRATGGGS